MTATLGSATVVHAGGQPPPAWAASVFLAGPVPRTTELPSWRPAAVAAVTAAWTGPGDLVVFVPEGPGYLPARYDHHPWEDRWLSVVDVVLFWVPRDLRTMPGLTTNVEFGRWEGSGRLVLGAPPDAQHVGYLRECAHRVGAPVAASLSAAADAVAGLLGGGAARRGAECDIPLLLWRTPAFTDWLAGLRAAGGDLLAARVRWLDRDDDGTVVRWVLDATIRDPAAGARSQRSVAGGVWH